MNKYKDKYIYVSILLIILYSLNKFNSLTAFISFILIFGLLSKNRLTIGINLLNLIVYISSLFTDYIYLDNLIYVSSIFTMLISGFNFIYPKEESLRYYTNKFIQYLKIQIIPILTYIVGIAVVNFVGIAHQGISDFLHLALSIFTLSLLEKIYKEDYEIIDFERINNFILKIHSKLSLFLGIVIVLTSIYLMGGSELTYSFQLFGFTILILNNLLISDFIENKYFKVFEIFIPITLLVLMLKFQLENDFKFSSIYLGIFIVFYLIYRLNKIKKQSLLLIGTLLYFTPLIGYFNNPFISTGKINIKHGINLILEKDEYKEKLIENISFYSNLNEKTYVTVENESIQTVEDIRIQLKDNKLSINNKILTKDDLNLNTDNKNFNYNYPVIKYKNKLIEILTIETKNNNINSITIQIYNYVEME